jgi:hypothetical protein
MKKVKVNKNKKDKKTKFVHQKNQNHEFNN